MAPRCVPQGETRPSGEPTERGGGLVEQVLQAEVGQEVGSRVAEMTPTLPPEAAVLSAAAQRGHDQADAAGQRREEVGEGRAQSEAVEREERDASDARGLRRRAFRPRRPDPSIDPLGHPSAAPAGRTCSWVSAISPAMRSRAESCRVG